MKHLKLIKLPLLIGFCLVNLLCEAQIDIRCHNMSWNSSLATAKVSNIVQDKEGYLWLGTLNGLIRYDGYRFKPYRQEGNAQVTKLYQLTDNKLLVQLRGKYYRLFDFTTERFDTLTESDEQKKEALLKQPSLAMVPDSLRAKCKRLFWDDQKNIVADDGIGNLRWIDNRTGEVILLHVYPRQLLSQGNNPYYSVVNNEERGLLWVSTNGNGLFVYDRKTRCLQHFGHDSQHRTGIDTDLFTSLTLDSQGNLWACKDNAPPACITVVSSGVSQLPLVNATNERSREVKALRNIGRGQLLIGNNNGGNYLSSTVWHPTIINELNGIDLIAACRHPQTDDVILGSRHHGVRIGGLWYTHTDSPASLGYQRVNDILTDKAGRIWLAVFNGGLDLAVADRKGGYTFRHFFTGNQVQSGRRMIQGADGRIWYGTGAGLFSFMPDSILYNERQFRYYSLDSQNIVEIHDLLLDHQRQLWVCTHGQGVFIVNTENDSICQLTTHDGLVYDAAQSAVEDGDGNVWIGTVNGLSCYHRNEKRFSNYYFATTPRGNFFSEAAAVYADGQLLFGTLDGVLRITPPIESSSVHHAVTVTDVLANGESRGTKLPHDVGMITFCFSDFSYASQEPARYVYRLEGYDREWSQPSAESEAVYRHLSPGKYTFHVRLYQNRDTPEGESTISLTIMPPWWRTWWAYLLYIVLVAVLGYVMFRQIRTLTRLRLSLRVERQLTEYKLRFFTNISHEFRTPLTLIQGSMEHLQSQESDLPAQMKQPLSAMNRSARRLLRLINQLLEFRKMQNDRLELHVQETDVVEFVRDVCQNFRDAAAGKNVNLQYLPFAHSHMMFIDRNHVDKMVYNLLSNAIKYTPGGGSIVVRLRIDEGRLIISVADTGVGIPKEKQTGLFNRYMQSSFLNDSIGIGLNLTWELARVHHGTVSFDENPQGGSIFTIELPADKSAYTESEFLVVKQEIAFEQSPDKAAWLADYRELAPEPMNDCRVLVVEDDSDVQQYLKQELQPYFQVDMANDGTDALFHLSLNTYQLVITDVRMPLMDGYELIRCIRKDPQLSSLPVIMLTAVTGEGQEAKAIGRGADAYLPKPFNIPTLISYCRRLMERGKKTDAPNNALTSEPSPITQHPTPLTIITDQRDHRFIVKLDAWIDMHLQESINTDEMAAAMNVGRTTFFDKLRQLTGESPARYVQRRKMERAKEMLLEGGMTTKQIAYSVGFDDPHYFSIRFKALFGVTPTEFAKSKTSI